MQKTHSQGFRKRFKNSGYWAPYEGKREAYGYFHCEFCDRYWESGYNPANCGQVCRCCLNVVYPFQQAKFYGYHKCNQCRVHWRSRYINDENLDDSQEFDFQEIEQILGESLVKYDPPIEIKQPTKVGKSKTFQKRQSQAQTIISRPNTEDILDTILPPREWNKEGKHFIQYVSRKPASREDVINLEKLLDEKLLACQARESGICPIQEELQNECFHEIIKQVIIDCPEKVLLVMRVSDELKMTIAAYQTLYQSAVKFDIRKQLESELENKVLELEKKKEELLEMISFS